MTAAVDVRPLTARSAILSVLLGAHPPAASGSEIVSWGLSVGISEPAIRVALSRMVGAGDLERSQGVFILAPRLVERQVRQDGALDQQVSSWDGRWLLAVTTAAGNDAATRAHLRRQMVLARFGELREGVWMRPTNIDWQPSAELAPRLEVMTADPGSPPAELAARLFDLDGWASRGDALAAAFAAAPEMGDRLAVAAAIVRHLTADPLLPGVMLPEDWPAERVRADYRALRADLLAMRHDPAAR